MHRFSTAGDAIELNILGQALSSALALPLMYSEFSRSFRVEKMAFKKMWDFGKYAFGSNSIYIVFSQMDILFVSSNSGVLGVALYNAAKILTRLFDMLSQVFLMFLIPFSSKAYAKKDTMGLQAVAEKSISFSTLLFIPVFILMFFFPEWFLHLLYKGKYDNGANIVRVFAFLTIINPWNAVVSSYLIGCGKVKQGFYFVVGLIILAVPAYVLLTSMLGPIGAALSYVSVLAVFTIIIVHYIQRIVPLRIGAVVRRTGDVWAFVKKRLN